MSNARTTASETLALCAGSEITLGPDGKPPRWVKLLPFGTIAANDGRPGWTLPAENADAVIAASQIPTKPGSGLIDFDHATQLAKSSRAAGWITTLAKANPETNEPGIWAQVDWTPDGAAALTSKVFRFFSPTFFENAAHVVRRIVGGSLVNNPAIDALPALASTTPQENHVDPLVKIRALLGLPADATADDINAKISQMCTTATASAALNTRFTAICAAAGVTFDAAKFGDTEQLAICTKLATPGGEQIALLRSEVDTLNTQLVTLRGEGARATAEQKVTLAIAAGKITPAQRPWAIGTPEKPGYAVTHPAEFDELMGVTPTILASGRVKLPTDPANADELTSDQLAMCAMTGVKPEDFKKTLAASPQTEEVA